MMFTIYLVPSTTWLAIERQPPASSMLPACFCPLASALMITTRKLDNHVFTSHLRPAQSPLPQGLLLSTLLTWFANHIGLPGIPKNGRRGGGAASYAGKRLIFSCICLNTSGLYDIGPAKTPVGTCCSNLLVSTRLVSTRLVSTLLLTFCISINCSGGCDGCAASRFNDFGPPGLIPICILVISTHLLNALTGLYPSQIGRAHV